MMAYPGNGEESNLPECGQNNVHGSGAHAGLPTETADRWVYLCTISVATLTASLLILFTVLHSPTLSSSLHESF